MNYLLMGGAPTVGKSETIYRLADYLISSKGFIDILSKVPPAFKDFCAVLEGKDKTGKNVRIIINSATDTPDIIRNFKAFYDANGTYDILISSVRDDNFYPRAEFFSIMHINPASPSLFEIPFSKITRRGTNFSRALGWYYEKMDKLVQHILSNPPFDL